MVLCEAVLDSEALLLAQHHFKVGSFLLLCLKPQTPCCRKTVSLKQRSFGFTQNSPEMENQDHLFLNTIVVENFSLSVCSSICLQNFSCALNNALSTIMIIMAMLSFHYKPNSECQNKKAKLYPSHW